MALPLRSQTPQERIEERAIAKAQSILNRRRLARGAEAERIAHEGYVHLTRRDRGDDAPEL